MKNLITSFLCFVALPAMAETGKIQWVDVYTDGVQIQFDFKQYGICSDLPSELKTATTIVAVDAQNMECAP